jgi:hypothetical protein
MLYLIVTYRHANISQAAKIGPYRTTIISIPLLCQDFLTLLKPLHMLHHNIRIRPIRTTPSINPFYLLFNQFILSLYLDEFLLGIQIVQTAWTFLIKPSIHSMFIFKSIKIICLFLQTKKKF